MDAQIIKKIKNRDITKEELSNYLMHNHSIVEICDKLAEYMISQEAPTKPITVTKEQFEAFFKLIGYRMIERPGGEIGYVPETRGGYKG